jgi:hypothetical protein
MSRARRAPLASATRKLEVAPLYSDNGRPGIATRFVIGLLLLKHI